MTYRYLNKIRFQAFFDSPNECAAVIVIFLGLLLGIILHFKKQDNKIAKPAFYFSSLLFVVSVYYLFLTYSRGGFVAFFLGLLFFITITKQWNKKILLSLTAISTMFLLSVPNLFVRIIGSINIFSDASIGNRLKLWKGCLAMFADHWFSGVGFNLQLGDYFTGWYQPVNMNTTYITAINDYLTIGACGGIFILFLYLFILTSLLWITYKIFKSKNNYIFAGIATAQFSYMVSGMFTTFYDISLVRYFYLSLIVITSILIAIFAFQNKKYHLKHLFIPCAISFSFCFVLFITGCIISDNNKTTYKYSKLENLKIVEVSPTKTEIKSIILYSFDSSNLSLEDEGKLSIRTLAEQGNLVISAKTTQGFDGLDEYKKVYQYALKKSINDKLPLFLIGQAEGGRFAFITSATNYHENLKGVWTIGIASDWPFDELSPENYIKQKCPITIIHGSEDKTNFVDNAKRLYKNLLKENKQVKLKIINGSNHYLLNERTDILKNIEN